jgi:nucleoid DNA-binding protein
LDITAFIRELLFSHDCVIIPGFGGFIGNYAPAGIDRNTGMFNPPVKQISFNCNLVHNDGLLAGRISEQHKVSYRDARSIVDDFAADLRRKLDRGEKIDFISIGTFVKDNEGNIIFEPDGSVNYNLDSYGFESFRYMPLGSYDVRKRIMKHAPKEPSGTISMRRLLWRAAVVIPLLAILVAVPIRTDLFRGKVQTVTLNPLVKAEFEHNKSEVDASREESAPVTIMPAAAVSPSEVAAPAATPGTWVAPTLRQGYFVITGSFQAERNALLQASQLREEGFLPEVVEGKNGYFRVCAMFCENFATALQKKDSIAKKYPGSWISRKK